MLVFVNVFCLFIRRERKNVTDIVTDILKVISKNRFEREIAGAPKRSAFYTHFTQTRFLGLHRIIIIV